MKKLVEFKKVIRELLMEVLMEKINSRDMPNGSSWTTAGKGWGAKNKYGVTNYWYGPDDIENKKHADEFAKGDTKKPTDKPGVKREAFQDPKTYHKPRAIANKHAHELDASKKAKTTVDLPKPSAALRRGIRKGSDSSRDDIR